jgi:hypothetical protein
VEEREPQQLKVLGWWLLDLFDENEKERKTRENV